VIPEEGLKVELSSQDFLTPSPPQLPVVPVKQSRLSLKRKKIATTSTPHHPKVDSDTSTDGCKGRIYLVFIFQMLIWVSCVGTGIMFLFPFSAVTSGSVFIKENTG